jgi:hypothetical protein
MAMFNARSAPAAATPTTLHTATGDTVVSSLVVCNRSATPTTFRIALRPLGAVLADSHYLYYDQAIDGNATFIATIGLALVATDLVVCYATAATVSFNLCGEAL